jgi:RimJ/RimL family protein N-acetyltransferase
MTVLIYDRKDELLAWAAEKIGIRAFRDDAQAIGLERDGRLCAVVVFDNFTTHDANMHIASDGTGHWLNRKLLAAAFSYPFIQCKLPRVSGMVAEINTRALRFDERIGFRREGYHPDACADGAVISLGLLRKNCVFIPKEYRQ